MESDAQTSTDGLSDHRVETDFDDGERCAEGRGEVSSQEVGGNDWAGPGRLSLFSQFDTRPQLDPRPRTALLLILTFSAPIYAGEVVSSLGEGMPIIAESDVESFGHDHESGRTMILTRPTQLGSPLPSGPLLQIQNKKGKTEKEWRLSREHAVSLSASGKFALIQRFGNGSRFFEVIGIDGSSIWQSALSEFQSALSISDHGTVFQMRTVEGGEFAFYDKRGKKFPVEDFTGPIERFVATWSPSGRAILLT